ncbi:hypothetical protein OIE62_13735 [Streptomyces scopuliridis]|uniref:Uncharacterized protein n=1 Tax=Streptomyces scopuliridis TaxID=452529 RepID=A0ACD4ZPT1_9ACTN|nr:hypothetical protein [Streptomyces scopuliridis]WSC00404.1 hypothetical protein OG835_27660 [Streptomyces scopuliridis]WSC05985.1 hypothetical protein OIE62_13735 [Streptomyces scopuliridis]
MTVSLPELEPVPATDCDVCAALCSQREEARAVGNSRMVRDWNDELRNHPHRRSGDWK